MKDLSLLKLKIERFVKKLNKLEWPSIVIFGLGILLGTIIGVYSFIRTDKIPATELDYEVLNNNLLNAEGNFEALLETDAEISISDDAVIVTLENEQCKVKGKYNKNIELLSVERIDKASSISLAIGNSLADFIMGSIVSIAAMCIASLLLEVIIVLIYFLGCYIIYIFKK